MFRPLSFHSCDLAEIHYSSLSPWFSLSLLLKVHHGCFAKVRTRSMPHFLVLESQWFVLHPKVLRLRHVPLRSQEKDCLLQELHLVAAGLFGLPSPVCHAGRLLGVHLLDGVSLEPWNAQNLWREIYSGKESRQVSITWSQSRHRRPSSKVSIFQVSVLSRPQRAMRGPPSNLFSKVIPKDFYLNCLLIASITLRAPRLMWIPLG